MGMVHTWFHFVPSLRLFHEASLYFQLCHCLCRSPALIPRLAQRRIKPHSRLFNIVHRLKLYPAQTVRCMYACTTYLLNAQHSIKQKERYFSCSASLSAHIESVFICFIWHWNFQGYIQTMLEPQGRIYRGGKGENFHPALEPPPSSPPRIQNYQFNKNKWL